MNDKLLEDVKYIMKKEYGYEVLNDNIMNYLDIRTYDEVVEDNLCYWEVGDLPLNYIDTDAMVSGDNDYMELSNDMYWKTIVFEDDIKMLKEKGYIKKVIK